MTAVQTPYDTGQRYEPHEWSTLTDALDEASPISLEMLEDRFGKVDFCDESGRPQFTVWVERNADGEPVVHVVPFNPTPVAVRVHRNLP